jgi:hypothetical protein
MALVNAFPLGSGSHTHSKNLLIPYIPTRDQASKLSNLYYTYIILSVSLMIHLPTLFMLFCFRRYKPVLQEDYQAIADAVYDTSGVPNLDGVHCHALSVFFVVMCFGSLHDGAHRAAEQYHALACAAVSLQPLIHQRSYHLVQALFLINLYKHLSRQARFL